MVELTPDDLRVLAWLRTPTKERRDTEELRRRLAPGSKPKRWKPPPPPSPESLAGQLYATGKVSPEEARRLAGVWARDMFTPKQVRAWMDAGLGPYELNLVLELEEHGIPPEALSWEVRKETMLQRIRVYNYSPRDIARTLREAGLLPKRSA